MDRRGPQRRWVVALALALAIVVLPLYAVKVLGKTDYTDFGVYYLAATRVRQGLWDQVYNLADGASPFRYAPPILPLFRPFAELPPSPARVLWFFLQYAFFVAGAAFIYRAVRAFFGSAARHERPARWITAGAMLFILRFCLDCFTIGQVSSLLFLCFAFSFYAWVIRHPAWTALAVLVPAAFKVGPGFLFLLFAAGRHWERMRGLRAAAIGLGAWLLLSALWVGSLPRLATLWSGWIRIVGADSVYFDASHYGSQSVKSALLRAVNGGWIGPATATALYVAAAGIVCAGIVLFWTFRRPRSLLGRGAFFALGLFPYAWFMPETFKYSLTTMAIPAATLLASLHPELRPRRGGVRAPADRLAVAALAFGALTLSLAGRDVVGEALFMGLQRNSMPLLATILLGLATIRLARAEAQPSDFTRRVRAILPHRGLGPWRTWPAEAPSSGAAPRYSLIVPIPFRPDLAPEPEWLTGFLSEIRVALQPATGEILLVPFGSRMIERHPVLEAARALERRAAETVRLLPTAAEPGQAAALRQGFLHARGRVILAAQLEQPAAAGFFAEALAEVERTAEGDAPLLVRASRRLPESRFVVPVRLLSLVYGRHRLGLGFNRLVRALLPVRGTDTHSGSWAMPRALAEQVFALQASGDFLFDLELALVAREHGARERELATTFRLRAEKSKVRVAQETCAILLGLPSLVLRHRRGYYAPWTRALGAPTAITADDWGLSPGVNDGMLELIRRGIVRRVSLMAYGGYLAHRLPELLALAREGRVELGLHFDLTFARSRPGRVLRDWILAGLRGGERLEYRRQEVRAELDTQLARLAARGVRVTYLDGHHHIHLVPGVLDAIAELLRAQGIGRVRLPYDPALWLTSRAPLNLLCLRARPRLRRHGFASLPCYYPSAADLSDHGRLRARLRTHLADEVIVHPALVADLARLRIPDPYDDDRVTEFRALRMLETLGVPLNDRSGSAR